MSLRNRISSISFSLVFVSCVSTLVISDRADAFELRGIQRNNDGVRRFRDEKFNDAYQNFAQGLGDLPFQAEVHYNLGRTFFENKEFEKAWKESVAASQLTTRPDLKFLALFQAASSAAMLKKTDEALDLYQQALEIVPDSKETKTNIELLLAGGQGGGDGEQQQQQQQGNQQNQPQDGQGEGQQQQQRPQQVQNPKPQPKPFKSEQLSKKDVENILDELKQQEEQIRAKFQREGVKDAPKDKDW